MVVQKAERKGRKRVVGRGRRREAREVERRCWGRGRSVWKTPVGGVVRFSWVAGGRGGGGVQKKRPFQILRRSRVVKVGLEVRYVFRDERAFSRVGRSVRGGFF